MRGSTAFISARHIITLPSCPRNNFLLQWGCCALYSDYERRSKFLSHVSICISTSQNRTAFGRIHRRDCHLSLFCVEGNLPSSLSVHDRSDPCNRSSMQMYRWHGKDLHLHCIHRRNIIRPCISSLTIGFNYGLPLFYYHYPCQRQVSRCMSQVLLCTGTAGKALQLVQHLHDEPLIYPSFPKPNLGLNKALREFVPFPVGMTQDISHAR